MCVIMQTPGRGPVGAVRPWLTGMAWAAAAAVPVTAAAEAWAAAPGAIRPLRVRLVRCCLMTGVTPCCLLPQAAGRHVAVAPT